MDLQHSHQWNFIEMTSQIDEYSHGYMSISLVKKMAGERPVVFHSFEVWYDNFGPHSFQTSPKFISGLWWCLNLNIDTIANCVL